MSCVVYMDLFLCSGEDKLNFFFVDLGPTRTASLNEGREGSVRKLMKD